MAIQKEIYWNVEDAFVTTEGSTARAEKPTFFYGTKPGLTFYLRDAEGSIWTGLNATDTAAIYIDDDFSQSSTPVGQAADSTVTIDADAGTITVSSINLFTAAFQTAIGTSEKVSAWCEVQVFQSGETEPSYIFQIPVVLHNVVMAQSGTPAGSASLFYTKAEIDSMLTSFGNRVDSTDIEITDATKGLILRYSDGTRIRIRGWMDSTVPMISTEVVV